MADAMLQHNQPAYSVSEISGALKRVVEDHFGFVRVRGELSGCKIHTSGHFYFSLKDDKALLSGVCWKGTVGKLPFRPEDGLEVVVRGRLTTYPGRSNYQIVAEWMEPAGAGALMALLEQRKAKLAAEGLFLESRKKPLPYLPQTIGVITSATGAVIRDILHRLSERFPVHVIVWPVAVQGEGAAEQVAAAIAGFNGIGTGIPGFGDSGNGSESLNPRTPASPLPRPDLLIVARGGGSIEDLWAFNEEAVVRAAANSAIPLISAVGHETDTTLIDYASDRRAPTPTAAAEMAVPVRADLQLGLMQVQTRMLTAATKRVQLMESRLEGLTRGLPRPQQLLEQAHQRLDDWGERLFNAPALLLRQKEQKLLLLTGALRPQLLLQDVLREEERTHQLDERMRRAAQRILEIREQRLASMGALLAQLDWRQVLKRGFALVRDEKGRVISTAEAARVEKKLALTFADGDLIVPLMPS